ncbi:MAG: DUF2721 domain-containing protein, partial [Deinococcales bacterium]|nr:DUF2721 domain-containing protein [Chitinophagaceae bacterium]
LGVSTFLGCLVCMYFIYTEYFAIARWTFAISLLLFAASLALSLLEIQLSTKALEIELSDMEDLEDPSVLEYLKKKFDRDKG